MEEEYQPAMNLVIDGNLIKGDKISVRVLGSILPDFQRSFDKIVMLDEEGKFKRGSSIKKKDKHKADFYLSKIEDGSILLPLGGRIKTSALKLYQWAIREPYNKALKGEGEVSQERQARAMEAQQKAGVYEERTQQDVIDEAEKDFVKFARAACLTDIHHALDPVRSAGENFLTLDFTRPGAQAKFVFDRRQAMRFGDIVNKTYMTQPAVYRGVVKGTDERTANDGFRFEATVLSSVSGQKMKVFVRTEEQIKMLSGLAYGGEVKFWASPLERYGGFDPYNGSLVFLNMADG